MTKSDDGLPLGALVDESVAVLDAAGVVSPEIDAQLLIGHVLGLSRGALQARLIMGATVAATDAAGIRSLVARRASREPLQHITGLAPFRALELHVGPGVFIPRPETEMVAQLAIDALRADAAPMPIAVDLGTGSGAIAIAMASEVPNSRVYAVERSAEARVWAERNIRDFGGDNTTLVAADLADALPELDGTVSVVASNPPYVPESLRPLDPEVAVHDPDEALYGGDDGLSVIPALSRTGRRLLRAGGVLVIEHAEHQSAAIAAILLADGWRSIAHHRDLTFRDRATTALR
ncbi:MULTISPECIES: peptide chain release factor N(5)-glutamine methyltransferase [unclassified Leifsonia]|uniref:peptide chain release factor N(5)-glutamine methyltransferase n=1 Tax=unclassified Leifsonia TaxID=2663824 RepID=UPI0006F7F1A2|nr:MULTISPECIES: peptide chain release factor N(5)-glutamine methyltransferase [unclassified Leifsonia]KQX06495.1 protein-(glutamine-N5) methyltransferase, release factor-specific [Leifsonia sp. Root1293]KRA10778.1 protein-(glutamine-N5) methyltransferase, release factor-specific [Leifsonia sp. Root60]